MYHHGIHGYHPVLFGEDEKIRSEAWRSWILGLYARFKKGRLDTLQSGGHEKAEGHSSCKIDRPWCTPGGCKHVSKTRFLIYLQKSLPNIAQAIRTLLPRDIWTTKIKTAWQTMQNPTICAPCQVTTLSHCDQEGNILNKLIAAYLDLPSLTLKVKEMIPRRVSFNQMPPTKELGNQTWQMSPRRCSLYPLSL